MWVALAGGLFGVYIGRKYSAALTRLVQFAFVGVVGLFIAFSASQRDMEGDNNVVTSTPNRTIQRLEPVDVEQATPVNAQAPVSPDSYRSFRTVDSEEILRRIAALQQIGLLTPEALAGLYRGLTDVEKSAYDFAARYVISGDNPVYRDFLSLQMPRLERGGQMPLFFEPHVPSSGVLCVDPNLAICVLQASKIDYHWYPEFPDQFFVFYSGTIDYELEAVSLQTSSGFIITRGKAEGDVVTSVRLLGPQLNDEELDRARSSKTLVFAETRNRQIVRRVDLPLYVFE